MKLEGTLLAEYLADPTGCDGEVRARLGLPWHKYYTVSVWPVAGVVRVSNVHRAYTAPKISKSGQG